MASAAEALAQVRASNELMGMAQGDLRRLAPSVLRNGSFSDVANVYHEVINSYSPVQSSLAADFYDAQRISSGARGSFRTEVVGHGFPAEALQRHAGRAWKSAELLGVNVATDRLASDMDRVVKQAGRNTGLHNAQRERVGWARVPAGPNPCAFCMVLASRGPVYDRETATLTEDGHKYHAHCNCVGHRIATSSDYPENFDPNEMYLIYREAANDVIDAAEARGHSGGTVPIESVAGRMRRKHPDLVRDGVFED